MKFTTYLSPKERAKKYPCDMMEQIYRENLFYAKILAITGKGKSGCTMHAVKQLDLKSLRKFYNGLMTREWHEFDRDLNIRFHGSVRKGKRDVEYLCRTLHIDVGNHMEMTLFSEQHDCDNAPSEFRFAYFVSGPGIRFSQGADFCNWKIREFETGRFRSKFELFGG